MAARKRGATGRVLTSPRRDGTGLSNAVLGKSVVKIVADKPQRRSAAVQDKPKQPPKAAAKPLTYSSPAIHARRRRILEEARRIIAERGVAGFSMNDLCVRAEVAKRTLYNAFQTKERIIAIAIREYFEDYISRIPYSSPVGTLQRNIERLIIVNQRNRQIRHYIRAIMATYFSPDTDPDIWSAMHTMGTRPNLEYISKLQAKRQLQPWVDAERLADDVIRYEYSTINDWCRGRVADDDLIPTLVTGYLTFMAGATKGAARTEIVDKIEAFQKSGIPSYPMPMLEPVPRKPAKKRSVG